MATESSHRLIMGKSFNCIFSKTSEAIKTIFSSYDHFVILYQVSLFSKQRPFCLVVMATLNFTKSNFFSMTSPTKSLKQYDSNLVEMLIW